MNREYHTWRSSNLQRNMELLIFGHAGRAILFFPTRMARFYDYENWRIVEELKEPLEQGHLQLFCVDSIDAESFYNQQLHPRDRIRRHISYEKYILEEVLPFMHRKNSTDFFEVAGCSMGAYHALNLALKYPLLFRKAVGMSGRYDLTYPIPHFNDLFDGFHNEDIYYNMPLQFIANLSDETMLQKIRKMEIILAIGETDPFLFTNRQLSQKLHDKKIPHQLHVWDGYAHRPRYWRQMVQLYL
jgi:esterase/lipase superfamily enzyme